MSQEPDTKPGNYYVSVRRDNGDFRLIAGPFKDDHPAALAMVDLATKVANDVDPRSHWYSFGTARTEYDYAEPGILNERLGLGGAM